MNEARKILAKQVVQMTKIGHFTYQDILMMETSDRRLHYETLAGIVEEENDKYESESNSSKKNVNLPKNPLPSFKR